MAVLKEHADRRRSRRRPLEEISDVTGVKVQSEEVKVVNASRGGILIECGLRLPPGTASQLEILRPNESLRVRGRVVRCEVTNVSGEKLRYRIAIAFSDRVDFIQEEAPDQANRQTGRPGAPTLVTDDSTAVLVVDAADLDPAFSLNSW